MEAFFSVEVIIGRLISMMESRSDYLNIAKLWTRIDRSVEGLHV